MKQIKLFILTALLTIVGNAYADGLKVAEFTINPGESFNLSIELDNPDRQYIMTEFWMSLPEGVSLVDDGYGDFMYEESMRFDRTHTLTISKESDGNIYHFLIYSSKNKPLNGNSGELFLLPLKAAADAQTGSYQGRIFGQIFSDVDKVEHNPADVLFNVTIGKVKESFTVEIVSGESEFGTVTVSPEISGTIEEDTELTVTATPSEGYHFEKWSDGTSDNPYSLTVSSNIQLSAVFAPNQYTVTFVFDNGDNDLVTTQDYKSSITKPTDPKKEGFTFKGWSPEVPTSVPANDVTCTAQWERNSYILKYIVDGETVREENVLYEDNITPIAEPEKEGYTFSGWSNVPETMPASDVTVTGTFTINKYKLTYMIDGKEYKTEEVEYGATVTPEPIPDGDFTTFEWEGLPTTMPAHDVIVSASYTTGIRGISQRETNDVYSLTGSKISKQSNTLKGLPSGVYVVNGKKVVVK